MPKRAESLNEVLDQIEEASKESSRTSLDDILEAIGRRSFGPLLVLAGLIVLAPVVGDIPGMPTAMGVFVFLITVQIVVGRTELWLPKLLRERSVKSSRLGKPLKFLRKPAGFIDRILKPRLKVLASEGAHRAIAGTCMMLAVIMPAMEIVPFSANAAGLVLVIFGMALIVGDGLATLVGGIVTVAAVVGIGIFLL